MGRTYIDQRNRLAAALEEDQREERYTASLTADVEQLLRTLSRRHAVKMDLGIAKRHRDPFSGGGASEYPSGGGRRQDGSRALLDDQMRKRIVAMVEMLRERAGVRTREDDHPPLPR